MYQRILSDKILYPPYISKDAISLMDMLLCKSPALRAGSANVREHAFLKDINWEYTLQKKNPPPYSLDCRISHFDPECDSQRITWSEDDAKYEDNFRSQSLTETAYYTDNGYLTTSVTARHLESNAPKRCIYEMTEVDIDDKLEKNLGKENIVMKLYFEVFKGYEYIKGKKERNCCQTQCRNSVENRQICVKNNAIQAVFPRGESEFSDIILTESEEEVKNRNIFSLPTSNPNELSYTQNVEQAQKGSFAQVTHDIGASKLIKTIKSKTNEKLGKINNLNTEEKSAPIKKNTTKATFQKDSFKKISLSSSSKIFNRRQKLNAKKTGVEVMQSKISKTLEMQVSRRVTSKKILIASLTHQAYKKGKTTERTTTKESVLLSRKSNRYSGIINAINIKNCSKDVRFFVK